MSAGHPGLRPRHSETARTEDVPTLLGRISPHLGQDQGLRQIRQGQDRCCVLPAAGSVQPAVGSVLPAVSSVLPSVQCVTCSMQCVTCSVQCATCSVQCANCSVRCQSQLAVNNGELSVHLMCNKQYNLRRRSSPHLPTQTASSPLPLRPLLPHLLLQVTDVEQESYIRHKVSLRLSAPLG